MPQEDSFSSQAADCKSERQLKTRAPHILLEAATFFTLPKVETFSSFLIVKIFAKSSCIFSRCLFRDL